MDRHSAFSWVGYGLLAVVLVGGIAAIWWCVSQAKDAAIDDSCRCRYCGLYSHLSQYHARNKAFPSNSVTAGNRHSWRVHLVKSTEYGGGVRQYDLNQAWDSAQNLAGQFSGDLYNCPWQGKSEFANYVAVVGPHTAFRPTPSVTWSDISDGKENTALLCEVLPSAIHWMEPRDPTILELIQLLDANADTGHNRGPGILFADGQVFRIAKRIPNDLLEALFTIDQSDGVAREELVERGYLHQCD